MFKLERLSYAIAEREGWETMSSSSAPQGSVSYRNHNPGNLRASPFAVGTNGGFSVFESDAVGFTALQWDIMQKAKGNTVTGLNGFSTLKDLIHIWAPREDGNDPENYLADICNMTGFTPDMELQKLLPY